MRTPHPRSLVALGAVVLLALPACSSDDGGDDAATTTSPSLTHVPDETTTTVASEPVDQTPPASTNGILIIDDVAWVASIPGNEIIAVDLTNGEILRRVGAEAGVVGPDDLDVGPDGRIWWTGFTGGEVGAFDPDTGEGDVVAQLPPGANPIAFGHDGRLFVALAITGEGLYEIDPTGGTDPVLLVEAPGNINGFEVAGDGTIWAPRFGGDGTGEVVSIDPDTGELEVLTDGLSGNIGLAIGDDGRVFVASVGPARVDVWAPTGDAAPETFAEVPTNGVDNIDIGSDGTLYVTAFDVPQIHVIALDGTVTTLDIGA